MLVTTMKSTQIHTGPHPPSPPRTVPSTCRPPTTMGAAGPVSLLRGKLFNYDNMIRARIIDGTITQAMDDEIEGMVSFFYLSAVSNLPQHGQLATFEHATSADPNMRAVFLEFPIVQNFVFSWANDKDDPSFLQDWQATLGRGGTLRQREARRQGPAVGGTSMPDPPSPRRPTKADRRTGSNRPLAMGIKNQTGPPQPRRRSHAVERPIAGSSRRPKKTAGVTQPEFDSRTQWTLTICHRDLRKTGCLIEQADRRIKGRKRRQRQRSCRRQ